MKKIKIIAWFVIFLILSAISNYIDFQINSKIPNMVHYTATQNESEFSELEKSRNKTSKIAFCNSINNGYNVNGEKINLNLLQTSSNFIEFFNLNILYGRCFNEIDIYSNDKNIIIPKSLAIRLYSNANICGQQLEIDGIKYLIVGVYNDKGTGLLFESYIPNVFICGYEIEAEESLNIFIKDSVNVSASKLEFEIIETLKTQPIIKEFDYRESLSMVRFLTIVFDVCLIFLPVMFIEIIKTNNKIYSVITENNSFNKTSIRTIFKILLKGTLLMITIYLGLELIHIPYYIIPDENIFEFSHYYSKFYEFFEYALLFSYGNVFLANIMVANILNFIINIIKVIVFWIFYFKLKKHLLICKKECANG